MTAGYYRRVRTLGYDDRILQEGKESQDKRPGHSSRVRTLHKDMRLGKYSRLRTYTRMLPEAKKTRTQVYDTTKE